MINRRWGLRGWGTELSPWNNNFFVAQTYDDWYEVIVEWLAPERLTKSKVTTKTKIGQDTCAQIQCHKKNLISKSRCPKVQLQTAISA